MIRMSFEGDRQLRRRLRRWDDRIRLRVQAAVNAGAMIVANDATRRAPYKTGNLRRSIHVEPSNLANIDGDRIYCEVGTDEVYGKFLEYGTRHMAARPYLRPALDENVGRVRREIVTTLRTIL